jgi:hypothetical protein
MAILGDVGGFYTDWNGNKLHVFVGCDDMREELWSWEVEGHCLSLTDCMLRS